MVAPHPDDEALMFGGHLARLAGRTDPVHVIAVTDGGAAYPDVADGERLGALRRTEQADALGALGLLGAPLTRLGLPDGEVAHREPDLAAAIATAIARHAIDVVLAPWSHDHHTDHEACGRAAARAAGAVPRPVTVVSGLFWSMLRDRAGADVELRSLALTADERARKRAAIASHRSQVTAEVADDPVLGEVELAIANWPSEYVIVGESDGVAV